LAHSTRIADRSFERLPGTVEHDIAAKKAT
jgi:hypothetical protein